MKYIDADKLIHDLEERIFAYSEGYAEGDDNRKDAIETLLKDVRYQCSLQQEQPGETCKTCGFYENNCPYIRGKMIPYPNRVCEDYTYSVMKAQDQQEVDLEKSMNQDDLEEEIELQLGIFPYTKVSPELPESRLLIIVKELRMFARHFARWGAEHLKK